MVVARQPKDPIVGNLEVRTDATDAMAPEAMAPPPTHFGAAGCTDGRCQGTEGAWDS